MNNPKAACKKINYIATDYRKKLLFDREQKLLKELEFKFGEEIVRRIKLILTLMSVLFSYLLIRIENLLGKES
jgi:hypothetical protein